MMGCAFCKFLFGHVHSNSCKPHISTVFSAWDSSSVLNCLQVYRLLATRGHYSIDIIVGFVVAVHVTNPAERLGLYFSSVSRQDFEW